MYSKFIALEADKKERIINAAIDEFAQKGYKNASTNEIVKKADISKGLIFHYFNSKKSLYMFVYDYAKDIFMNEFYSKINYEETDIIKRWRQIALLKIELVHKYPSLYDFLVAAALDDSVEIRQELDEKYKDIIADSYNRLFEGIDTSGFKKGLDKKHISEIILWVMQGLANRQLENAKHNCGFKANFDFDAIMKEFDEYIELLKKAFYK